MASLEFPAFLLICFAAIFLTKRVYQYWQFRDLPGPFTAAWSDAWFRSKLNAPLTFLGVARDLHQRYGSVVRIGPNRILFSDPEAVPVIYSTSRVFSKAVSYNPSIVVVNGREVVSLIGTRDETRVSALKRGVASAFTPSTVFQYEPHMDHTITQLIDYLAAAPAPVDLAPWLNFFTFDTISRIAFSEDQGFMRHQMDVDSAMAGARQRFEHWNTWWTQPALEYLVHKNWLMQKFVKPSLLARLAVQKVQARMAKGGAKAHNDILNRFIEAGQEQPRVFDPMSIVAMTVSTIHAGAETTSNSLSTVFYYLLTNPVVLAKLRAEFKAADIKSPTRLVDLDQIPYLEACIREAQRLAPLVGNPLEREVPAGGAMICGRLYPAGTIVASNVAALTHDPNLYGPDHEVYRPERWLESDEDQIRAMKRSDLSFSAGRRVCLGQHIAWGEMKKLLVELLLAFDIELNDPNMQLLRTSGVVAFVEALPVKFTRRT